MDIGVYILPISDKSPCGEKAKHELEYQEVEGEIQKLTAMSSAQDAINWDRIVELSQRILTKRSKDLTIAGYLCAGLFKKDGYQGICDGLRIYTSLLENFWEGLFPQKIIARGKTIEWLDQRVGTLTIMRVPGAAENQSVLDAYEEIKRLSELIQKRFGSPAPSISNLLSGLTKQAEDVARQQPAVIESEALQQQEILSSEQSAALPSTPPPPASPPAATIPIPQVAVQPGASDTEVINAIRQTIAPLRANNLQSPLPYRLLRCIKWDIVLAVPVADGDGKTKIPAPRAQIRTALDQLVMSANWSALIEASEGAFQDASGTFWLDLQRMTYKGLSSLGYGTAAKAVITETAAFLERFSQISGLKFADNTPFADAETMQWIASQVVSIDKSQLQITASSDEKEGNDLQEALELANQRNLEGALDVLYQGINQQSSYKGKFIRRLSAGKYCLQLGQPVWAKALLEGLYKETKSISIEEWEPVICVEIWKSLYQCYQKLLSSKKIVDEDSMRLCAEQVRDKLFQYDIKSAIGVENV